jgi:hypothetical protein
MEHQRIKIGDKVRSGVYVLGEWRPMHIGIVVSQTADGSVSGVDRMSLHGGAPWVVHEQTSHLRKIQMMSADGGEDIPL